MESIGVFNRRCMWEESMGVASGCGCKEVYRFPHITYPYSSCFCFFFAAAFLILFILNFFIYILHVVRRAVNVLNVSTCI